MGIRWPLARHINDDEEGTGLVGVEERRWLLLRSFSDISEVLESPSSASSHFLQL